MPYFKFFSFLFNGKLMVWVGYAIRIMMMFLWLQRMGQFGDGVIIYVSFKNLLYFV